MLRKWTLAIIAFLSPQSGYATAPLAHQCTGSIAGPLVSPVAVMSERGCPAGWDIGRVWPEGRAPFGAADVCCPNTAPWHVIINHQGRLALNNAAPNEPSHAPIYCCATQDQALNLQREYCQRNPRSVLLGSGTRVPPTPARAPSARETRDERETREAAQTLAHMCDPSNWERLPNGEWHIKRKDGMDID